MIARAGLAGTALLSVLLMTGCGEGEAASTAPSTQAPSTTTSPTDGASVAAQHDGTCQELEAVYDPQRSDPGPSYYDPETHLLTLAPDGRNYTFDITDAACQALPRVGRLARHTLARERRDDRSQCHEVVKELKGYSTQVLSDPDATVDTPRGTSKLAAQVAYAHSLCDQFGIAVPPSRASRP